MLLHIRHFHNRHIFIHCSLLAYGASIFNVWSKFGPIVETNIRTRIFWLLHQLSVLNPPLFIMDVLSQAVMERSITGICGYLVIVAEGKESLHQRLIKWKDLDRHGLRVNVENTEELMSGREKKEDIRITEVTGKVESFRYLGYVISQGGCEEDARNIVKSAWAKCHDM